MILIGPLQFLKGYASEEVRLVCSRSRELCKRLGEGALLVPAFWGLTAYFLMRGEMSMAAQITEEFSALAQKEGDAGISDSCESDAKYGLILSGGFSARSGLCAEGDGGF